jgi:flagellar basal-body rod modification protein FlgD
MENTEFIAQMAQFSSLEQISNMNSEFTKMAAMLKSSEAGSMLGKTVELYGPEGAVPVRGMVEGVTRGENPEVLVNGTKFSMDQIKAVYN